LLSFLGSNGPPTTAGTRKTSVGSEELKEELMGKAKVAAKEAEEAESSAVSK